MMVSAMNLLRAVEGRRNEIRRRLMTEVDERDILIMTDMALRSLWRVLNQVDDRHARETCLEWIDDQWELLANAHIPRRGGLGIDPMDDIPSGRYPLMIMISLEAALWAERLIGAGEDEVDRRGVI